MAGVVAGGASTAVVVAIANASLALGANAQRGYQFKVDGTAQYYGNTVGGNITGEWVASGGNSTVGAGYEAMATLISGTPDGFTAFGGWVNLNGNRLFGLSTIGSFTLQVRPTGGAAVVTATITIT